MCGLSQSPRRKHYAGRQIPARLTAQLASTIDQRELWITLPITLDESRFEARVYDRALFLTPVEFRLLARFIAHPGRVFSRQQLMDALYVDHRVVSERTVDSHVKNLRRKLAELASHPISSVYGVGYRFEWSTFD